MWTSEELQFLAHQHWFLYLSKKISLHLLIIDKEHTTVHGENKLYWTEQNKNLQITS